MKRRSLLRHVVLFAVTILLLFATACTSKDTQNSGENTSVRQEVTYNLGTEPETLDPAPATGLPEATIQNTLFEGLVRYNEKKQIIPGIAESWDISPDGMTYTFKLRDAKWSNGDPVVAEDFVYAWKRLLSPETGAEYAYQLFYLKNAEEYNAGKAKADEVGVKALDARTLQVTLNAPTPYFLGLTAFPNLFPVNKKAVETGGKDWYSKPETMIGNGPFKLEEWEHNQKLTVVKNPNYWDAKNVKLEKITFTMVEDSVTALTMFDTDQIDIAEDVPNSEVKRLLEEGTATVVPDPSTYYYTFNTQKKPFDDVRVRRAFALAIDRKAIVEQVTQAGEIPAYAFVPYGFPDETPGKDFRAVGGELFKEDIQEAQRLLAEAGYPGGKGFPEVTLLYNTDDNHPMIAEAIQEMWKKNLGVNVKLANQEWKVFLKTRAQGNYSIARAGWGPDYLDPMTFLDLHVTGGGNNDAQWSNKQYDELIDKAKATDNPSERMESMHAGEKILMDEMPIMPIYFYTNVNLYKPWVKGIYYPTFGSYQEFKWGYIEK